MQLSPQARRPTHNPAVTSSSCEAAAGRRTACNMIGEDANSSCTYPNTSRPRRPKPPESSTMHWKPCTPLNSLVMIAEQARGCNMLVAAGRTELGGSWEDVICLQHVALLCKKTDAVDDLISDHLRLHHPSTVSKSIKGTHTVPRPAIKPRLAFFPPRRAAALLQGLRQNFQANPVRAMRVGQVSRRVDLVRTNLLQQPRRDRDVLRADLPVNFARLLIKRADRENGGHPDSPGTPARPRAPRPGRSPPSSPSPLKHPPARVRTRHRPPAGENRDNAARPRP